MRSNLKAEKGNPVGTAAAVTVEALENRQLLSTYYIATSGSDSAAGSLAQPYATLSKGLNVAKAGDTLIMRGGTYSGNTEVNKQNITIEGMAGETVKIVSPTNNSGVYFGMSFGTEAKNVTVRNLDISGGYYYAMKTETTRNYDNTNGTYHGASDLLFENVKFHDSGTHVIKLSPDSDRITFKNCEIYNSGRRDADQGQGMDAVNVDDLVMQNNYVHDTTQNAIFVKGGSQRAIIEGNTIRNAGFGGILLGQDTDAGAFDTKQNPNRYEAIDCIARNNIVDGTKYGGLEAWSSLNSQFINNWVSEAGQSGQAGIFISMNAFNKPNDNLTFQGNTIGVQADDELISIIPGAMKSGLSMSNNKYYGTNRIYDGAWQGTVAQWITHSGTDTGSVFVSTGNPPPPDNIPDPDPDPDPDPTPTPGLDAVSITTTVNENGNATLTGTITNPGVGALTLLVNWGDGSAAQTFNLPAGATSFSQAHKYLDDSPGGTAQDNKSVTVTLRNDGVAVGNATATVLVKNVAPTMSGVSITSTVVEGGTATLAGSIDDTGTLDSFTLAINWGDGSAVQNVTLPAGTTNFSQTHKYADDSAGGTFNVSVTLADDDTGSASANKTITVTNANPTLSSVLLTPMVANGGVATLSGVLGDAGTKDAFNLAIDWGDGSAIENVTLAAGTTTFSRTHIYVNPGDSDTAFAVGVTVTDGDGGSATVNRSVTVTNATIPPALTSVTMTSSVNEGSNATLAGTITNPGSDELALAIDWGDGSAVQNVTLSPGATGFTVVHKYADDGESGTTQDVANVGITLLSGGVASSTASTSVTVKNVAPTLSNLAVSPPDGSGVATLTGVIADAAAGDSFTLLVNWGDGSDPQTLTFAAGTTNFSAQHTYAPSGLNGNGTAYPVSVTLKDDDNGSTTASAGSVTVVGDGVLKITGTSGADVIDIQDTGKNIKVTVNGKATTYSYSSVDNINVDAGAGNDVVTVGDGMEDVYVFCGDGDDKVIDGDGSNTVSGGAGKDQIYGGLGNDRLNGNGGNDKLLGEAGADRLHGDDGNDYLDGGSSNDRFYTSRGADTMMGQGGNDKFYLRDGVIQMIFGGSGSDWCDGDASDQMASIESLAA